MLVQDLQDCDDFDGIEEQPAAHGNDVIINKQWRKLLRHTWQRMSQSSSTHLSKQVQELHRKPPVSLLVDYWDAKSAGLVKLTGTETGRSLRCLEDYKVVAAEIYKGADDKNGRSVRHVYVERANPKSTLAGVTRPGAAQQRAAG